MTPKQRAVFGHFNNNGLGKRSSGALISEGGILWSYNEPLLIKRNGFIYFAPGFCLYFSRTTSGHQRLVRNWLMGLWAIPSGPEQLENMVQRIIPSAREWAEITRIIATRSDDFEPDDPIPFDLSEFQRKPRHNVFPYKVASE